MGFSKTAELRDALAGVPNGVITPTQRSILHTINSYADDTRFPSVCYIGYERMSAEIGISPRALQQNLHRLGDGRRGKRVCTKPGCKHLGIVQRHATARTGTRQNYSIDWKALRSLSSVKPTTYSESDSRKENAVECEVERETVRSGLPTYKDNKQNKQTANDFYLDQISRLVPEAKRHQLNRDELSDLLDEWGAKGCPRSELVAMLEREVSDWTRITHPRGLIEKKFRQWIADYKPTVTPPRSAVSDFATSACGMPE